MLDRLLGVFGDTFGELIGHGEDIRRITTRNEVQTQSEVDLLLLVMLAMKRNPIGYYRNQSLSTRDNNSNETREEGSKSSKTNV